nr:MAG TPA: hypothetical protein [Caudoviricetes sp.]
MKTLLHLPFFFYNNILFFKKQLINFKKHLDNYILKNYNAITELQNTICLMHFRKEHKHEPNRTNNYKC